MHRMLIDSWLRGLKLYCLELGTAASSQLTKCRYNRLATNYLHGTLPIARQRG